ncbi:unnamed protein product [Lupinus luteus]|uniref:non-specific serine/threonine protein kinase n=1 Tax=Lupinus luteus TaxID=3873 RepID=A0AAV1YHF4_LUPLU
MELYLVSWMVSSKLFQTKSFLYSRTGSRKSVENLDDVRSNDPNNYKKMNGEKLAENCIRRKMQKKKQRNVIPKTMLRFYEKKISIVNYISPYQEDRDRYVQGDYRFINGYCKNNPRKMGHLYIIDVSQVVDLDHPHALDFLREDCVHVSNGVVVMTITELFDFIINASIADDVVDSYLEEVFVF